MASAPSPLDITHLVSKENLKHIVLDFRQMKAFAQEPLVMAKAEGVMDVFAESVREILQEVGT